MKHLEKVREVLKELNRLEREYVDGVLLTVVAETALQAHEEEVRELVRDRERLNWLETQGCWIGIFGMYEAKPQIAAGKGYAISVRDAVDKAIAQSNDK